MHQDNENTPLLDDARATPAPVATAATTSTSTSTSTSPLTPTREPNDDAEKSHFKNISRTRFWCLFLSIVVSWILVYFDSFFMASSHPVITSYFNASNAASWLTTVFFLSSTIFVPFYGRISDITGRRTVFIFSLSMFALTTAWCGAAGSIGSFIVARFFCGLGAGGVTGISNVIVSDIVHVRYRGIYQSYLNMGYGLGCSLGAALGGLICEALGWRAAFYMQVPLIVVLLGFSIWATPKHLGPSLAKAEGKSIVKGMASFDFAGAGMLTLCLTGLILGMNVGGSILPWGHPAVVGSIVMFAVSGVGLIYVENRAARPLLPMALLSSIPYGNLNWGNLLGSALSASANFNIPLFLQAVKMNSPTRSGLMLVPALFGGIGLAVVVGFAIAKTRKLKPFIVAGVIFQFLGMAACGLLQKDLGTWQILAIIQWVVVGQGLWFPANTVATLAITVPEEQAVVVTTLNLCRSLGSIFGVAYSSWILQNTLLVLLPQYVTGSHRDKIVRQVRESVKAIAGLPKKHQEEVIQAYAMSLRTTFLGCAVLGLIMCLVVLPVRISDIGKEEMRDPSKSGATGRVSEEDGDSV